MDARSHEEVVPFPPDEIRNIVKSAYDTARSHLENLRKQKILLNLLKAATCEQPSSIPDDISHGSVLAMQSLSNISPRSTTMERVDRAPSGLAWVRVRTNLKAPDNYKDKFFIPYLGESDEQQNFSNSMAADADVCPAEQYAEDDISDVENTTRVTPVEGPEYSPGKKLRTIKKRAQKNGKSRTTTARHAKTRGQKSSEATWDRAAKRVALENMMKKLRLKHIRSVSSVVAEVFGRHSSGEIESCYKNVLYRRQAYKESDDEALLRTGQKEELLEQLKGTVRTLPGEALQGDSIPFFFCRQCYIYNCLEHGTQTAKPVRVPSDRTKKDTASRQGAEEIESRCPDRDLCQCWCVSRSTEDAAKWWRQMEMHKVHKDSVKSVVLELFTSFGKDPCRISEVGRLFGMDESDIRLTCHRVGYLLDTLEETKLKDSQSRQVARRAKKKYRTKAPRGETESMKGGQRVDYAPCQHDGPCTAKSCRCVENGVNCEKYCSCNHNRTYSTRPDKRLPCNHAFQGCTCRSAVACISNACVCYSYGRECDPDLCRACFDCRDSDRARSCRNVGLLMGERQRTVVGHSETHGWGAFAATDIAKGEIIGEYVGEVVSHIEADRRGRLYDEIDYSFLFNITEDWALDSTRIGNKLRYCNHHFKPNCNAKLMRVGGDVRVGLYAVRDIGKHEELFFDYKYKNGPAWSMPGSDGNVASSRRKQESAKKRAPAVDDDDTDEEVIPVPKKRVQTERRQRNPLRQIRGVVQHANRSDADELNLVTGDATHLRAKNPNVTRSGSLLRDNALFRDMDRSSLPETALLSRHQNAKNLTGASGTEKYGAGRSHDGIELVSKTKRQNYPVPHERPSFCNGTSGEITLREETSRRLQPEALKTSRRQAGLQDTPPDSRANNVVAVDRLDDGDCDFRTSQRRRQNGLNHENYNISNGLSVEKERIEEMPTLRDVFGSDLESLDENANQSVGNPGPHAGADPTRNRNFSAKSTTSRLPSVPAPGISLGSSVGVREVQFVARNPANSMVIRRTKDQIHIPAGISKVRAQRRDKVDKASRTHRSRPDHATATETANISGLTKSVGRAEPQQLNRGSVKDRSVLPRRKAWDRGVRIEAGFNSTLDGSCATPGPSGRSLSEVPHVNLVSDDDENLNCGAPDGALSNSSDDGSNR